MREIRYTNRFKRDYQREKAGRHGKKLDVVLMDAINMLVADVPLPRRYFDHPLAKKSGASEGPLILFQSFFGGVSQSQSPASETSFAGSGRAVFPGIGCPPFGSDFSGSSLMKSS